MDSFQDYIIMTTKSRLFLFLLVTSLCVGKSFTFSECSNGINFEDPSIPGVYNCLSWMAHLQSTGVDMILWCSVNSNYQKCCLSCQNYFGLVNKDCVDIAYSADCEAKKKQGLCSAKLADARLVQFYCRKTCNLCMPMRSEVLSCDRMANSCIQGSVCSTQVYFGVSSVICICPSNRFGTYCEHEDPCIKNPCHNDGTCRPQNEKEQLYACVCREGCSGINCQYCNNSGSNTTRHTATTTRHIRSNHSSTARTTTTASSSEVRERINKLMIVLENNQSIPCSDENCNYRGSCTLDSSGEIVCSCKPEYTGKHCQTIIEACHPSSCKNGGSCYFTNKGLYCSCPDGFYGTRCELNRRMDPCVSMPCLNGGSCRTVSQDVFYCYCKKGSYGDRCQHTANEVDHTVSSHQTITLVWPTTTSSPTYGKTTAPSRIRERNICTSNPCLNQGSCNLKSNGSYYCICQVGYAGYRCEFKNGCANNPCMNGGSCTTYDTDGGYRCTCLGPYTGPRCQMSKESITTCNSNKDCLNGGVCEWQTKMGIKSRLCRCELGYTGSACERKIDCAQAILLGESCMNGGTCTMSSYGYIMCQCRPNTYGKRCEFVVTAQLCARGDQRPDLCQTWQQAGLCQFKNTYNSEPVPLFCPFACKLCPLVITASNNLARSNGRVAVCKDTQSSCAVWSSLGLCNVVIETDPDLCRKSCGLCN